MLQWNKLVRPVLVLGGILLLLLVTDIGCIFRATVGFPCPGCGQTRAWFALFSGQLTEAFQWHPLFWLTPLLLVLVLLHKEHLCKNRRLNALFWFGCFALYLGVYIWRLCTLFPHTPPMTVNRSAPLFVLLEHLFQSL